MIVNGNTYCRIITPILPYEYQGVEYIESTGTQRIDTGIIRDLYNEFKFEGSFSYSDIYTRQLNGAQGYTYIGVVDGYYQINNKRTEHENVVAIEDEFTPFSVVFDTLNETLKYSINGVTNTKTYVEYEDEPFRAQFYIFSLNDNVLPSSCKIKYWKIYKNNILVRDFIPCYRKSDNEIGMYDTVNKVFYTNQGTGTFLKGNNIVHTIKYKIPVEEKEYIKGHVTDGATSVTLYINGGRNILNLTPDANGNFYWERPKNLAITSLRTFMAKSNKIDSIRICLKCVVTDMWGMFVDNPYIEHISFKGSEITIDGGDFRSLFYNCEKLKTVEHLEAIKVRNVTSIRTIFYTDYALEKVGDMSGWNVSLVTESQSCFQGSSVLETIEGLFDLTPSTANVVTFFRVVKNLYKINSITASVDFHMNVGLTEQSVANLFNAVQADGITITVHPATGAMIDAQMDAGEGAIFDAYMNSDYDFDYTY